MCKKMSLQSTVGAGEDPVCPGTVISRRRGNKNKSTEGMSAKKDEADIPVEIGSPEFQEFAGDQALAAKARVASQSGGGDRKDYGSQGLNMK